MSMDGHSAALVIDGPEQGMVRWFDLETPPDHYLVHIPEDSMWWIQEETDPAWLLAPLEVITYYLHEALFSVEDIPTGTGMWIYSTSKRTGKITMPNDVKVAVLSGVDLRGLVRQFPDVTIGKIDSD